ENYFGEGVPFSRFRSPDVAYHYDLPKGSIDVGNGSELVATQTSGQVAWVEDQSGEEHMSYDARGRVEWRVKRIHDPGSTVLTAFKTEMRYDSLDRVRELIYPDTDRITYT